MFGKATIITLTIGFLAFSLSAFIILKEDSLLSEVRGHLKDPDSANFRNIEKYDHELFGSVLCGEVNAVNGFGAYNGWRGFVYDGANLILEGESLEYEFTSARYCSEMTNIFTAKAGTLVNIGKQILAAQQLHMIDNRGSRAVELNVLENNDYLPNGALEPDFTIGGWRLVNEGREARIMINEKNLEICDQIDEHPALNLNTDRENYHYGCQENSSGKAFFMSQ